MNHLTLVKDDDEPNVILEEDLARHIAGEIDLAKGEGTIRPEKVLELALEIYTDGTF